uniref:Odorant receptor n=1 Tax=Athetis lepigone TaxID=1223490 RepID=A0A1B3B724_ATHLE|nr:putative odorant receptor OR16 [Athetis lepigone]
MTSLLRKFCFKNESKTKKLNERVYDKAGYDYTLGPAMHVLKLSGIRMTHKISEKTTKLWNIYYWSQLINLSILVPSETASMWITVSQAETFIDAIQVFGMMPCFGCLILSIIKSYKMVHHRPMLENLVNELRDMWPEGELSEEEHVLIKKSFRQLRFISKGYYYVNNALLISYMTPTIYFTILRNCGYDYPIGNMVFMYWLPFDVFRPIRFEILLVAQTWHAIIVIWLNVAFDISFCLFLCHITTQFDLLARRVQHLFYVKVDQQLVSSYPMAAVSDELIRLEGERVESYGDSYWEERQHKEIVAIVQRHHALIRLRGDVEDLCSFALLINFINSSIIICFCGFCCVLFEKWNEMAYKSFLTTSLSQTFLLCWYGQKLIDASQRLSDALYNCGWYNTGSKKARSAVLIMMHRAQKGIYVTTYGFSIISLASYSTIIKSAWSYFTLLLNFFKDKSID